MAMNWRYFLEKTLKNHKKSKKMMSSKPAEETIKNALDFKTRQMTKENITLGGND